MGTATTATAATGTATGTATADRPSTAEAHPGATATARWDSGSASASSASARRRRPAREPSCSRRSRRPAGRGRGAVDGGEPRVERRRQSGVGHRGPQRRVGAVCGADGGGEVVEVGVREAFLLAGDHGDHARGEPVVGHLGDVDGSEARAADDPRNAITSRSSAFAYPVMPASEPSAHSAFSMRWKPVTRCPGRCRCGRRSWCRAPPQGVRGRRSGGARAGKRPWPRRRRPRARRR